MIHNFLFDFDGTLADTIPVITATLERVRERIGIPYDMDYARSTIGEPLVKMGVLLCGEDKAAEFVDIYTEINKEYFDLIRFYPGMEELLKYLTENGASCAIVTSRRRDSLFAILRCLNAEDYFDIVVPKEAVSFSKPHPAAVEYALTALNAVPGDAVMIGDTNLDIQCGKGAGVKTIGVSWGIDGKDGMEKCHPDYIADTYDKLLLLCKQLLKK